MNVASIGAMYGNLRPENIMIKLNPQETKIEVIKFISFRYMCDIEDADNIVIPDQIEHLPPDMLSHLSSVSRFAHTTTNEQD